MATEHDPIREWHAQRERSEYALQVCADVKSGKLTRQQACGALVLAGIPDALIREAFFPASGPDRSDDDEQSKAPDHEEPTLPGGVPNPVSLALDLVRSRRIAIVGTDVGRYMLMMPGKYDRMRQRVKLGRSEIYGLDIANPICLHGRHFDRVIIVDAPGDRVGGTIEKAKLSAHRGNPGDVIWYDPESRQVARWLVEQEGSQLMPDADRKPTVGDRVEYTYRGFVSHVWPAGHGGVDHDRLTIRETPGGAGIGVRADDVRVVG